MIEKEFNDRIYTKSTAKREKYTIFMLQNIGLFPLLDSATHVRIQKKRLSQNETAFFCVCKKIGQVLTSLSQNLPVSLIFCILGNQVKISQR